VAFAPDHPPDAVQEAAPVDDHVSVDDPPAATVTGDAARDTVGTDEAAVTVTVALCEALPPVPVQLRA
jgi:hypothetical protein